MTEPPRKFVVEVYTTAGKKNLSDADGDVLFDDQLSAIEAGMNYFADAAVMPMRYGHVRDINVVPVTIH